VLALVARRAERDQPSRIDNLGAATRNLIAVMSGQVRVARAAPFAPSVRTAKYVCA
jgi:hypothetical protein